MAGKITSEIKFDKSSILNSYSIILMNMQRLTHPKKHNYFLILHPLIVHTRKSYSPY